MRRSDIKALPSLEVLRHLFAYNPETGVLIWRVRPTEQAKRIKMGMPAGTVGKRHGYLMVGIGRSYYLAHRIIWKLQTGEEPADQIDHKDTDRLNNTWDNLRPADNGQNRCNTGIAKNNRSGVKGVCWEPGHKAWKAYVNIDGKQVRLGRFASLEDAADARARAAQRAYGDFLRVA
jgi:hypothetical protein